MIVCWLLNLLYYITKLGVVNYYAVVEVEGDGLLGHYLQAVVVFLALFECLGELLELLCLSWDDEIQTALNEW